MATPDPFAHNPFKGVGRNDPCPCGSGRKFKKCCLGKSELEPRGTAWPSEPAHASASDEWSEGIEEYDPLVEPNPAEWLALGEQERIDLVMAYHQRARIRVPNAMPHAIIHAVIETQIAMGDELPVRRTAQRLIREGLDRHDAIHAIGSVLAGHLNDLMREVRSNAPSEKRGADPDPSAHYFAELERLTAEEWLQSG
jgi:hypothetical protein